MNILWESKKHSDLEAPEIHEILGVRQAVFIIEQQCIYEDADKLDASATHIIGRSSPSNQDASQDLVAYARLLSPGAKHAECSFGRVLVTKQYRRQGFGKKLVEHCINECHKLYPDSDICISAQLHLQKFYEHYGFSAAGKPYDYAGLEHIDMLLTRS